MSSTASNLVSDSITLSTTDGGATIVLDQDAENNKIEIETDQFSKGILLQNDPTTFLLLRGGNAVFSTSNGNLQSTFGTSLKSIGTPVAHGDLVDRAHLVQGVLLGQWRVHGAAV